MRYSWEDGRMSIERSPEEKADLLRRLRKVEGQIRGLQQMVEDNRYCLDLVQQIRASSAGLREVALMEIADHLRAGVEFAVHAEDGHEAIEEMLNVLRVAMRQ